MPVARAVGWRKPLSPAQAAMREFLSGTVLLPQFNGNPSDHGLMERATRQYTRGSSTESHSVFTAVPTGIYEGNNKQAWMDLRTDFCHLCQEPLGSSMGVHVGDRDHTNLQYFLFLYASYPRGDSAGVSKAFVPNREKKGRAEGPSRAQTSPTSPTAPSTDSSNTPVSLAAFGAGGRASSSTAAVRQAQRCAHQGPLWVSTAVREEAPHVSPSVHAYATTSIEIAHLHTVDDALRRAELEGLLWHLQKPPHCALSHVIQGKSPLAFWYSGEKMWKPYITKVITQLFPPLSAGMMTNLTQKCWGRSNGERMYDALRLADMQAAYGWGPYEGKEKKTFFLRQIIWELMAVELREEVNELTKHLVGMALRRLAFEMVFLQSMDYMNRIQAVYEKLGSPSVEELAAMNLL